MVAGTGRSGRVLAVALLAVFASVASAAVCGSGGGTGPGTSTPGTPTAAGDVTQTATAAAATYQVTFVETHNGQRIGTQVLAQQPPLRAWWQFLDNGYFSGWIYDGSTLVSCSGKRGGEGDCSSSASPSGPPATGGSASGGAQPPAVTPVASRVIAGREATCWTFSSSPAGQAATMCSTGDGILLYTSAAGITLEAIEVRDSPDPAMFTAPYAVKP